MSEVYDLNEISKKYDLNSFKKTGFFKEFYSWSKRSLHEYLSEKAVKDKDKICYYLQDAQTGFVPMDSLPDPLNPDEYIDCAHCDFTDGVWYWSGELAHLVANYNLKLPESFVDHMRANNWEVPIEYRDMKANITKVTELHDVLMFNKDKIEDVYE